jgi:hypothetical protein
VWIIENLRTLPLESQRIEADDFDIKFMIVAIIEQMKQTPARGQSQFPNSN